MLNCTQAHPVRIQLLDPVLVTLPSDFSPCSECPVQVASRCHAEHGNGQAEMGLGSLLMLSMFEGRMAGCLQNKEAAVTIWNRYTHMNYHSKQHVFMLLSGQA